MQITPLGAFTQTLDQLESQVKRIEAELDEPINANSRGSLERIQGELSSLIAQTQASSQEIVKAKPIGSGAQESRELTALVDRTLALCYRTLYCNSLLEGKWEELASVRDAEAKTKGHSSLEELLADLEERIVKIEGVIDTARSSKIRLSAFEEITKMISAAIEVEKLMLKEAKQRTIRSHAVVDKFNSLNERLRKCNDWEKSIISAWKAPR